MTDRKEYQKQYYQKSKAVKTRPLLFELIGCLITYILSILVSIHAFQQFSTGFNSVEMWLFFVSIESLVFFLSFNLSQQERVFKIIRLTTAVILTLGLNFMVSKGAYDSAIHDRLISQQVEKDSTLLRTSIHALEVSIEGFQQREMHTKAVELIDRKDNLLKKLELLGKKHRGSRNPENQFVMILMRFFISILNISVANRIGQILSRFIS